MGNERSMAFFSENLLRYEHFKNKEDEGTQKTQGIRCIFFSNRRYVTKFSKVSYFT